MPTSHALRPIVFGFLFVACGGELPHTSPYDSAAPLESQAKGSLSGTVALEGETDHGQVPIELQNELRTYATATSNDGSFKLTGLVPGSYTLRLTARSFTPQVRPVSVALGAALDIGAVTLAAKRVEVVGNAWIEQVVNGAPKEVGGVVVSLVKVAGVREAPAPRLAPGQNGVPPSPTLTAVSQSNGSYSFASVPPGTYAVAAAMPGVIEHSLGELMVTGEDGPVTLEDTVLRPLTGFFDIEADGFLNPTHTGSLEVGLRLSGFNAQEMAVGVTTGSQPCILGARTAHQALLPLPLAGEGKNVICVRYFGEESSQTDVLTRAISRDTIAPEATRFVINGDAVSTNRDEGDVMLSLTAFDSDSGVAKMKLANATTAGCDADIVGTLAEPFVSVKSWTLATPATEDLRYVCLALADAAGNWSAPVSDAILFDTTEPQVGANPIAVNGGAPYATSLQVMLALDATGATAMRIANDGAFGAAPWEPYRTSTYWVLANIQGERRVDVMFRDAAQNESGPFSAAVTLDTLPPGLPSITLENGSAYTTDATIGLTLTASDAVSMQISASGLFDGVPEQPFSTTADFSLAGTDGTKFVYARFRDEAGNWTPPASSYIVLDRVAPTAGFPLINGGATYTRDANVTLTLPAAGAHQMYVSASGCLAGGTWVDYVPSMAFNLGAPQGLRTIYVNYRDEAGNVSPCRQAEVTLDGSLDAPSFAASVTGVEGVAGRTKNLLVWVSLTGLTGDVLEVAIANDSSFSGAAWQPVAAEKSWVIGAGDGSKTIYVKARDAAGNESNPLMPTIALDQTGPEAPAIAVSDLDGDTYAVSQSEVELRWTTPADPKLAGYEVERYVPGYNTGYARILSSGSGTSTFRDTITDSTGLVHYYRVRSFDDLYNYSGWSSTILAFPFPPVSQAAWLWNSEGLRYLFTPPRGTFSLQVSRAYEDLAGTLREEDLGVDTTGWSPTASTAEFAEMLYIKSINQDNTLAYRSEIPTRADRRDRLAATYKFVALETDNEGRPHVASCEYPQIRYGIRTGQVWTYESVGVAGCWDLDLDLDSDGKAHLVHGVQWDAPYDIYYITNRSGAWTQESIATVPGLMTYAPRVAVAADGVVHVVWEDASLSPSLRYAYRTTAGTWTVEPLAAGTAPDIAVDSTGKPWVIYVDSGTKIAGRTGPSTWSPTTINATFGQSTSIVIDPSDALHLVYTAGGTEVRYAKGPAFVSALVATVADSMSVSVSLDARGNPHIGYFDTGNGSLHAASYSGTWQVKAVDAFSSGYSGNDRQDLAVDGAGNLYLAYTDYASANLNFYARQIARTDEFAASGSAGGLAAAVDPNDDVHIVYHAQLLGGHPAYITNKSGAWVQTEIDTMVTINPSIALDTWGRVHAVYNDNPGSKVKYAAEFTPGTWTKVEIGGGGNGDITIDASGNRLIVYEFGGIKYATAASTGSFTGSQTLDSGSQPSLALKTGGGTHLLYSSGGMRYRLWNGAAWGTAESFAPTCSTGTIVDSAGVPHVACYDGVNRVLKYATRQGGVWTTTNVDRGIGASSDAPSIVIGSTGWVAIVYEDPDGSRFRFATNASGGWAVARLGPGERYGRLAMGPNDSLHALYVGSPADNYYGLHHLRDFFGVMPASIIERVSAW